MKALIEVLLIDDNSADTDLTAEFLKRSDRAIHLQRVSDGIEAMAFLHREGKYSGAIKPQLIMLDLNMPGKNGWEVLIDLKSDSALRAITVVIFTTSRATKDIDRCLQLGANSYVSKPNNLEDYASTVNAIGTYWFDVASMLRLEGL
jgi:two-component system response regulator